MSPAAFDDESEERPPAKLNERFTAETRPHEAKKVPELSMDKALRSMAQYMA